MKIYMHVLIQILFFQKNEEDVDVIDSIFSSYTSINQSITTLLLQFSLFYVISQASY